MEPDKDRIKRESLVSKLLGRKDISAIVATVVLVIIFSVVSDNFFTSYNLFNMSRTASLYMFISLGQVFVLITGDINLSIAGAAGLTSVACGYFFDVLGMPAYLAIAATLGVGCLIGLINGLLVIKMNLSSFIATLITSFIYSGLVTGISQGYSYTNVPESFSFLGRDSTFGIPNVFILMLVVTLILWYFFRYTVLGRRMLARGGNEVAARLSGIKTKRLTLLAHIFSGFFIAVTALLWISRQGTASPQTGRDWMYISFPIAALGGTALTGGEISPVGLVFASFLITMIRNGLTMLKVDAYYEQTFLGFVMFFAVAFEIVRIKIRNKQN